MTFVKSLASESHRPLPLSVNAAKMLRVRQSRNLSLPVRLALVAARSGRAERMEKYFSMVGDRLGLAGLRRPLLRFAAV